MKIRRPFLPATLLVLACASIAYAQNEPLPNPSGAPPKMLLLVRQEIQLGKAGERRKLQVASARAYDRLDVPLSWLDLESISGPPEALFFDPLDSLEQLDQDFDIFGQLLAAHPELARTQEQIEALLSSESTLIAVRREDLGYRPQSIDLSKTRFMRLLEVRLHPGFEPEFVEALKILAEAYEKINADGPWIVYQVNVGAPSPAFLVFAPMRALKQDDDLLDWRKNLREAEGEETYQRLEQIAKDAYATTESNLYVISPEMSHVSNEFADGDPQFWFAKPSEVSKPPVRKAPAPNPKP
jgi:hypothetical protein